MGNVDHKEHRSVLGAYSAIREPAWPRNLSRRCTCRPWEAGLAVRCCDTPVPVSLGAPVRWCGPGVRWTTTDY